MEHRQDSDRDELRAKFTSWLQRVLQRARIDYIRHQGTVPKTVSIDLIVEDSRLHEEVLIPTREFEFENDKLSRAFQRLSPTKQKILIMLFIDNVDAEAIAEELGCTIQHVYNQRSLALKELRRILQEGGGIY